MIEFKVYVLPAINNSWLYMFTLFIFSIRQVKYKCVEICIYTLIYLLSSLNYT